MRSAARPVRSRAPWGRREAEPRGLCTAVRVSLAPLCRLREMGLGWLLCRAAMGGVGDPSQLPSTTPGHPTDAPLPTPAGMSYKELDERLENDPNIIVCWK